MKRIQLLFRVIWLSLLVFALIACVSSSTPTPDMDLTATAEYATAIYICCTAVPQLTTITPEPPKTEGEIVLYRGNPQRTGVYNLPAIRTQPQVKWQMKINTTLPNSPLIVGDILYTGSVTGRLFALDLETGAEIWSVSGFRQLEYAGAVSGDVIVTAGIGREVKALDRYTGNEIWTFQTDVMVQATPLIVGERVYIATYQAVYALDLKSGALVWEVDTGEEDLYVGGPAYEDGVIYATGGKLLLALDAETGDELWRVEKEEQFLGLAVANGFVYVGNWDKTFYVYDQTTGEERWKFQGEGEIWSPPAVNGTVVYSGNTSIEQPETFYALDALTGALRWSFEMEEGFISEPIVAEDVVYFSDGNHETQRGAHHLYALDATMGKELWKYEITSTILTAPALGDGVIYITSTGEVIALQ